jgi:hypothetical protein
MALRLRFRLALALKSEVQGAPHIAWKIAETAPTHPILDWV